MNAHTEINAFASHDDIDDDVTVNSDICEITGGEMLLGYDEDTYSRDDETFISDVRSAEVCGLHLGGGVVLSRDQLCAMLGKSRVADMEAAYAEARRGLI